MRVGLVIFASAILLLSNDANAKMSKKFFTDACTSGCGINRDICIDYWHGVPRKLAACTATHEACL